MTRPIAPAPIVANIPPELQARPQWIVWRYEERQRRDGSTYWTKVPYVPGETRKARSNRPSTWCSYSAAIAAYEQNPIGLHGIGYMFSKDDPYVGGDQDHDLSTDRIPPTYAEISPSGQGIKFIARATGDYGRKTPRGELYSHGRFFTITGRIIDDQHAQITDQQEAVEAFAAALGSSRASRNGGTANGSRAALAAAIDRPIWDEANELIRTQRERLLRREQAAAGREDTQLAVLLRGDYAEYHQRWPGRNLYRADGSLDDSQVRFWHGCSLYGRGFTFAQYAALMHIHFGQAKPTADLWKQELAAMWDKYPNYTAYTPHQRLTQTPEPSYTVPRSPRGRAGDHAALVDRVYQQLRDHRAGSDAIVKCGELAGSLGIDRRTIVSILNEIRAAGRIQTRRLPRHGGLVITFSDVIYAAVPAETASDQPGTACNLDVIYSPEPAAVSAVGTPQIDVSGHAALEETKTPCVSSDRVRVDHSLPTLADAVVEAFDVHADRPLLPRKKGKPRRSPLTRQRIESYITSNYPALGFTDAELDTAIDKERFRRKLADIPQMTAGTLQAEIRHAEHLIDRSREAGDQAWRWWSVYRNAARSELAGRPPAPDRPTGGRKPCEAIPDPREVARARQAEFWALADIALADMRGEQMERLNEGNHGSGRRSRTRASEAFQPAPTAARADEGGGGDRTTAGPAPASAGEMTAGAALIPDAASLIARLRRMQENARADRQTYT